MSVDNYIHGGLDLVIDENNNVYFVEANSFSSGFYFQSKVYNSRPLKPFADYLDSNGNTFAMLTKTNRKITQWFVREFNNLLSSPLSLCFYKNNAGRLEKGDGSLITKDNKKILPDILIRKTCGKPFAQEKAGIEVINPTDSLWVVIRKHKCLEAVNTFVNEGFIKTPINFMIEDEEELFSVINNNREIFGNGVVLKPACGEKGKEVFIYDSPCDIPENFEINRKFLIEERTQPKKIFGNKFWNVRTHTIDGEYVGGVARVSGNPVVSVSRGAYCDKIPKSLEGKLRIASEKIVKAIDRYTKEINNKKLVKAYA